VIYKVSDCTPVTFTPEQVARIIAGLKTLLPYTNATTNLVILKGNELRVRNRDTDKLVAVKLPCTAVPPLKTALHLGNVRTALIDEDSIGFNAKYLITFFTDVLQDSQQSITLLYGPTSISGVTVQTEERICLQMPLRTFIGLSTQEEVDAVNAEKYTYIEGVKVLPRGPAKPKIDKNLEKIILKLQTRLGVKALVETLEMI
jgi:hypothetical protein